MKRKILLVDDDSSVLELIKTYLGLTGFHVTTAENGATAIQILKNDTTFFMIVSDYNMPGMQGTELLQHVKLICPFTVRVLTSGGIDREDLSTAIQNNDCELFIPKPWNYEEALNVMNEAMNIYTKRSNIFGVSKTNGDLNTICYSHDRRV